MGYFCPNHVHFQLNKYRRVTSHDTEEWCKVWLNVDLVVSKLAWEIGWTFIKALKNLKICTLMGFSCPKRNVSARKFQRNYVSWHWKVIQNLSENWLVGWKMTRNSVNFHANCWKSENLQFMDSFCRKDIKFYMKSREKLFLMTLESDAKCEEKLALVFKIDMTNLVNFNESRSLKICTLMCYFCQ